jgi:hypothetical protein
MFSPVQAIIAAEAGVKARAENVAAVIKILISISLENSQHIAGRRNTLSPPTRFRGRKFLCAAMQRNRASGRELAIAGTMEV